MGHVTSYHAAKIKADYPQIYSRLLGPFLLVTILAPRHINVLDIASDSIRQLHIAFFSGMFFIALRLIIFMLVSILRSGNGLLSRRFGFLSEYAELRNLQCSFFNLFWLYMFINHRVIFSP
jgi:hypothetical protein